MSLYEGCECPICGKKFADTDDVVVCPVCGSPHHRACYKTVGHCGNEDYHKDGRQWEGLPPRKEEAAEADAGATKVCRVCGTQNPRENFFCQRCGERLNSAERPGEQEQAAQQNPGQFYGPFGGFAPVGGMDFSQELEKGVTVKDACDYVGPNSLSFVLRFKEIVNRRLTINWGAFFFGYFYCFYRKMYKLGAIMMLVFLLGLIPSGYYAAIAIKDIMEATGGNITLPIAFITEGPGYQGLMMVNPVINMINLVAKVVCAVCFNKAYYKQMVHDVLEVKESGKCSAGTQECSFAIALRGGINRGSVLITVTALMLLYLAYGYITSLILLS